MERAILASALRLYLGLGTIVLIITLGFAPLFPLIFNLPDETRSTASLLVVLLA